MLTIRDEAIIVGIKKSLLKAYFSAYSFTYKLKTADFFHYSPLF